MIYPTVRAVLLCALGAPLGLALALAGGSAWLLGVAWAGAVIAAVVGDAAMSADWRTLEAALETPPALFVGREATLAVRIGLGRRPPRWVELALDADQRLAAQPERLRLTLADGHAAGGFVLKPERRGEVEIRAVWVRWRGPLGMAVRQGREAVDWRGSVVLDLPAVKTQASRLISPDMLSGAHLQFQLGGASEFHALVDYRPGMNPRLVDWKQSARHRQLLAKEFEAERNHQVILAVDCGRQMCEPVRGAPRIDRALQAGLLLAFGALKAGDRVGLYSFDERPRVWTGALSGQTAFAALQRQASRIDYTAHESNYTLGLVQLGAHLRRRSLVVVFTEFTDSTTAELMIENVARLMKTHLVLFVVAEDEELQTLELAEVGQASDVTKAVLAGMLAGERELVIGKLRHMGVDILHTDIERLGPALLARYVEIKQRDLL